MNCQKHKMNKRTLETPAPVLLLELRCKLMYWKQNTPECSFSVCTWSSSHTGQPSLSQPWADGLSPQQGCVSATSRFASLTDRSLASRFDLGLLAASETALLLPVWCVYVCSLHALLTPATRFSSCFWLVDVQRFLVPLGLNLSICLVSPVSCLASPSACS